MQPFALIPRSHQQFDLLGSQGSRFFLQEQVDGHAKRSQRRLQLMRDGGNDSPLQFVLMKPLGHVFQNENDPRGVFFSILDGDSFGTEKVFFTLHKPLNDGRIDRRGQAVEGILEQAVHPVEGEAPNLNVRFESEDLRCCFRRHLHAAFKIHNGHGIGKALEDLAGGALDAIHPCPAVPPEFSQTGGHLVEGFRKPPDFVVGGALDDEIEIPLPNFVGRPGQALDGAQDPSSREQNEDHGDGCTEAQQNVHVPPGSRSLGSSPLVGVRHVLLIHLQDCAGSLLDLVKERQQPVEIGRFAVMKGGEGIQHFPLGLPVLCKKVSQMVRRCFFARQGDVVQFDLEGMFKRWCACGDELPTRPVFSQQCEQRSTVHALQSVLHLLAGDDAPVVFPQKDVYGMSQGGELQNALHADDQYDDEQPSKAQR